MDVKGKTIVLSGTFSTLKRQQAADRLTALGATVRKSVSSKTDMVFAGAKSGGKQYKALSLGIPVYDEAKLMEVLGGAESAPLDDPPKTKAKEAKTKTKAKTQAKAKAQAKQPVDEKPSLQRRFQIALGRLRRRSDVIVYDYYAMHAQPFGAVADQMPEDLVELYESMPATRFHWCFVEDAPEEHGVLRTRGGMNLRAPDSKGWWDVTYCKSFADNPEHSRGLLRTDGYFTDPDGTEWPSPLRYQILEGADEGGLLWRVHPDGSSSYHVFGSDGDTKPIPFGSLVECFEAFLEAGLAGNLGRPDIPFDAPLGVAPDPTVRERLANPVPPRITADVEVVANEALDWQGYRAVRLGGADCVSRHERLGQLYGLADLPSLPWRERGRRLAEATAMPKVPSDLWVATNKALFSAKKTKKKYDEWRLINEGEPQSLLTLKVKRRETGLPYGMKPTCFEAGYRVLMDLPGFRAPEDFPADLYRFTPERPSELHIKKVHTESEDEDSATLYVTAPTAWVQDIVPGHYESPAITPL